MRVLLGGGDGGMMGIAIGKSRWCVESFVIYTLNGEKSYL